MDEQTLDKKTVCTPPFCSYKSFRDIDQRLDAVEELSKGSLQDFLVLLKGIPDLERAICRIYYKKCTMFELIATLKAFDTYVKKNQVLRLQFGFKLSYGRLSGIRVVT